MSHNAITDSTATYPSEKPFSFRRLTPNAYSWIHFKLAILVWAVLLFNFTPNAVSSALGTVSIVAAIVSIFGIVMAITGLVMSVQPGKTGVLGLTIEYSGLYFATAVPVTYLIVQIYLASTLPNGDQRIALCALSYAVCAALAARIRMVYRRRKRLMVPIEQVS